MPVRKRIIYIATGLALLGLGAFLLASMSHNDVTDPLEEFLTFTAFAAPIVGALLIARAITKRF